MRVVTCASQWTCGQNFGEFRRAKWLISAQAHRSSVRSLETQVLRLSSQLEKMQTWADGKAEWSATGQDSPPACLRGLPPGRRRSHSGCEEVVLDADAELEPPYPGAF